MNAAGGVPLKSDVSRKDTTSSLQEHHKSQEEWISDEEFYTEGSSDEDDMALRMKQRERRDVKRENSSGSRAESSSSESRFENDEKETKFAPNTLADKDSNQSFKWRPTHGSVKLVKNLDPEHKPMNSKKPEEPC